MYLIRGEKVNINFLKSLGVEIWTAGTHNSRKNFTYISVFNIICLKTLKSIKFEKKKSTYNHLSWVVLSAFLSFKLSPDHCFGNTLPPCSLLSMHYARYTLFYSCMLSRIACFLADQNLTRLPLQGYFFIYATD